MVEKIKYLCVFCGSSSGNNPAFIRQTELLGQLMVQQGYGLIYGGASVGLMGVLADAVLNAGGHVVGVIPSFFNNNEIAHKGLSELRYVESLAQRKQIMIEQADAFVTLPGGYGTLDELFEVMTLSQLDRHQKASVILNIDGYYQALKMQLETMKCSGLLKNEHAQMLQFVDDASQIFEAIHNYKHPEQLKWISQITQNK